MIIHLKINKAMINIQINAHDFLKQPVYFNDICLNIGTNEVDKYLIKLDYEYSKKYYNQEITHFELMD